MRKTSKYNIFGKCNQDKRQRAMWIHRLLPFYKIKISISDIIEMVGKNTMDKNWMIKHMDKN